MPDSQVFAELVDAVAGQRDREAFATLFDYFAPRIKAYLMRLGAHEALAEDMTQDVMLTLWHKAALFDPAKSTLATWLYRVARNRRIDAIRRDKTALIDVDDPFLHPEEAEAPDSAVDAAVRDKQVRVALAGLPDEQVVLIKMAFFRGMSHSQIADESGVPLGTVKSRIRLGFTRLRGLLEADKRVDTEG